METKEILCPKCKSKEIIKRGLIKTDNRNNTQRYGCKECNNRFVLDNPYFRMRNKEQIITQHGGKIAKTSKVIHQVIKSDSGGFNYKIERFHNTLRERTKVMRGFHGCISSAQTLMKGFEIYYNWIRNNIALEGQTPSEIACPNVQIENKNGWLELIQRGYNGK